MISRAWHVKTALPAEKAAIVQSLARGPSLLELLTPEGKKELRLVGGKAFSEALTINREYLLHGDFLAPASDNDYEKANCFLLDDGKAGFAIGRTGWMMSLFSNEPWGGFARMIGPFAAERARKLVCIIAGDKEKSPLPKLYREAFGFVEVAVTKDDTFSMTRAYGGDFVKAFLEHNGRPSHLFMVKGKGAVPKVVVFDDYLSAYRFVDELTDSPLF